MNKHYPTAAVRSDRDNLIAEGLMLVTRRCLSLAIKESNYGSQDRPDAIEMHMDRAKTALMYRREFVG